MPIPIPNKPQLDGKNNSLSQADYRSKDLLAGLEINLNEVKSKLDCIALSNQKFRQAWGFVELSFDLISEQKLIDRWPKSDLGLVLQDTEISNLIKTIGDRPEFAAAARQLQVDRTITNALGILETRVNDPDCSIAQARNATDILLKLNTSLKEMAVQKFPENARQLNMLAGVAQIKTPEFPKGYDLRVTTINDGLNVIRAMRCINIQECTEVWELLNNSLFVGSLTQGGW